jgi:hypothetical protein
VQLAGEASIAAGSMQLALEAFLVDEQESDEELTEQSMPCWPTTRCGQLTM